MAERNVAQTTQEIFSLLSHHEDAERTRIIDAVTTLLGISPGVRGAVGNVGDKKGGQQTAEDYFAQKDPQSKMEELAIAARFLDETSNGSAHSKADLRRVINEARRNFDDSNFRRDIDNAKTKGLFAKNKEHDRYMLSYYGKEYVGALPDREAVAGLRKPKSVPGRRKATASKVDNRDS